MIRSFKEISRIFPLLLLFVFNLLSNSFADEIILKNGDRLSGKITTLKDGTLTLKTEYSNLIKIRKEKIQSIAADTPLTIRLTNGETLKGKIHTDAAGNLTVEGSIERSAAAIQWDKVTALNPAPVQWKGNITVGANSQSGNSQHTSVSVGAEASRKTREDRFSLRFLYNYAEDEGEITIRNIYGALKYDYFFAKSFYGYLGIELLNDKFKDLQLRTAVGPGIGYQIWDDDIKSLLFEAGASYYSEDLKEGDDHSWVTGRLAGKVSYKIKDVVILSNQVIGYPSFRHMGRYQLRNEAAITSALSSTWALKVSNILERDSDPPDDVKKNDLYWILALQYSF